jgi:hypothetical protein
MTTRITVSTMTPTACTREFADRLGLTTEDIDHILNAEGNGGACYTFTAFAGTGSANTGSAYMDLDFVAIEWGGDPQWFTPTGEAHEDDEIALTLALNGDLSEA